MILPGFLAVAVPVFVGKVMGVETLGGLLGGALVTGVMMAIFMANAGGAWDNAKKYIENGAEGGKGSEAHKAAVVGDTVGDPFKGHLGTFAQHLGQVDDRGELGIPSLVYGLGPGQDRPSPCGLRQAPERRGEVFLAPPLSLSGPRVCPQGPKTRPTCPTSPVAHRRPGNIPSSKPLASQEIERTLACASPS